MNFCLLPPPILEGFLEFFVEIVPPASGVNNELGGVGAQVEHVAAFQQAAVLIGFPDVETGGTSSGGSGKIHIITLECWNNGELGSGCQA